MPNAGAYVVLGVNVTPAMADALRAVAAREGVTMSAILREALAEYLLRRADDDGDEVG